MEKILKNEPYKVSILIPVYGVEKYIKRCAISLFEQTYSNLEFVFVNDCTCDGSIAILNETIKLYPKREQQVKIIHHKKNRGLAASRNTAVEMATGEFLVHVDSDDWLDSKAVEVAVKMQAQTNADFVSFNSKVIWPSYTEFYKTPYCKEPLELVKLMLQRKVGWNIWGRLIRKSLYTDNNISVIEGCNMGEDAQVVPKLVYNSKIIANIDMVLYYYDRTNNSSYTSKFSPAKDEQTWLSIKSLLLYFTDTELRHSLEILKVKSVVDDLKNISKAKRNEAKQYFYSVIRKRVRETNRNCWKCLSLPERLMLYISNKTYLSIYVRIAGFLKHYILRHDI